MALTQTNPSTPEAASSQVETLAKLYLEGKPAEIPKETIAQLCDWLMDEFQQLPLNLQFSDYMRYDTVEEMFADIEQGHLWVSADSYDSAVYPNPIYGFIFQGVHDYDHYLTNTDFSLEGEIAAYNFTAKRVPSLEIQKILYSEIVLRSAACLYLEHAATPKIVLP
ncbi:transposase [Cyanobacteria bacterium FACHB-471]|nr:transposase [Cyanobacteria bacterium FACHB-471]